MVIFSFTPIAKSNNDLGKVGVENGTNYGTSVNRDLDKQDEMEFPVERVMKF